MEKPEHRDKIEDWFISGILWSIKELNFKSEITTPVPEDLAKYYLDKPQLYVWLYQKGSEHPVTIKMGWRHDAETSSEKNKEDVETKEKPVESKETTASRTDQPKTPEIVYAIVDPPNDKPSIFTLDGAFIGRLRVDLDQLSKKE
jgi:hypothetical protein